MADYAGKVEVEKLSAIKRQLRIAVPAGMVAKEINRAYRDLGKQAKIKGFRPGKAPRSVLEMYYGSQVEKDVADTLVRRSLAEALQEQALAPVDFSWPEVFPAVAPDQDFCYSVDLEIPPEFTAAGYKGLTLEGPPVAVDDQEVEARLEEVRHHNTVLKPLEEPRGIQEGDFVILSYQGYFAGEVVEGAKGDNIYLEAGLGKFNKDFEANLMGLAEGGQARFAVALPDDFFNPLIAGKVIEFEVQINEIKAKIVPELDDDFARSLGGNFQNMADLRSAIRMDIINTKERQRQQRLENQVTEQLLASHDFEAPPTLVLQEQEGMVREQTQYWTQQGIDPGKMDRPRMMELFQPQAEKRVRMRLLLDQVARQEGLAAQEAEVDAALARMAVSSGQDVAKVRQHFLDNNMMDELKASLGREKSMKFILDHATVTDVVITAPASDAATEQT